MVLENLRKRLVGVSAVPPLFVELARDHSDAATASVGGDLGAVQRGALQPTVERVAFQLQPKELSEVGSEPVFGRVLVGFRPFFMVFPWFPMIFHGSSYCPGGSPGVSNATRVWEVFEDEFGVHLLYRRALVPHPFPASRGSA